VTSSWSFILQRRLESSGIRKPTSQRNMPGDSDLLACIILKSIFHVK